MSADRYLVLGLRRSGLAACEAISRCWPSATVIAVDDAPDVDVARLSALGIEHRVGAQDVSVQALTAVIKSPGVPGDVPLLERARAAGVPVWSEVELAARMLPNPIIGVTGTNGKTTTTELIGAMLRAGGLHVEVAGNVGRALSELPGRAAERDWVVCELSSFQLEDIERLRCRVAVVLNITPDHLDRHGTIERYRASKLRIMENQTGEDTAVLNGDDPLLRHGELPGAARRVWFDRSQSDRVDWEHAGIRGDHNLENSIAAAAAAEAVGVSRADRDRALREFVPPPHRLQQVADRAGVRFIDDSKATNPEAAIKALTAFDHGVHLILGGSSKGGSFDPLARAVAAGPVSTVDLTGDAAAAIAPALDAAGVHYRRHRRLAEAVTAAAADARPGDTVLLSPACASFDEFRDYVHRGEVFAELAGEVRVGR